MPYKLAKGKWRGEVRIKGLPRKTRLFDTKKEASAWERKAKENPQTDMGFLRLSNDWLDHTQNRYTHKYYRRVRRVVLRFATYIGSDKPLEAVTLAMANDYLNLQSKKRSKKAANEDRKTLAAMFGWGNWVHETTHNPFSRVRNFPTEVKPQYTPPEHDILKLLAVTSGQDRVILEVFIKTGARRSEVWHLVWDDVNFEKEHIRLWSRKTSDKSKRERYWPMSPKLKDSLYWWWKNRPIKDTPYIFYSLAAGPNYGQRFTQRYEWLRDLCIKAGTKHLGYHALRRYAASILADKHKVDSKSIQTMLGHSTQAHTERYLHKIQDNLRKVAGLLDE